MNQRYKRRRFPIVDKSLQYRFLARILIYSSVIVIFMAIFLFVPEIVNLQNESLGLDARMVAANKILTMHTRVWPVAISLICVIGVHSFFSFLRYIGPLYRFRMSFYQVKDGDLSFRVKLRKKDHLHDEEDALNEMIEVLANKLGSIQLASRQALKSFDELEEKVTEPDVLTEIKKGLFRVHRHQLETVIDNASYFRLQDQTPTDED
ncbi:MAG: methyl-accepting chemotaxis protein [Desulfobacteraceae bacterium]|nr:methyl-accepting chemotaxis protein [Desulfobacteraceae bacterium]